MSKQEFDYFTFRAHEDGSVDVLGWKPYPRSSVLAGQIGKHFVAAFDTEEEARAEYPNAEFSNQWTEPVISVAHLPGEDDPVPGGMYPDDWEDGI